MSGILSMVLSSGGGSDIEIITVGELTLGFQVWRGYGYLPGGSIDDGFFSPKGGSVINGIYTSSGVMTFVLEGKHSNDGWETMTLEGVVFERSEANYYSGGGTTTWQWLNGPSYNFGVVGSQVSAIFA